MVESSIKEIPTPVGLCSKVCDRSLRIATVLLRRTDRYATQYALYRRDDASNDTDNAFKVQLEVNGTFVENTKNPSQPITIDVAQGEAESGSYGVEAVFPAQDGLPAGTYTDTVYVDFVTGDSQ